MKPDLDDLLPFYVNGTLGPADRQALEQHLREDPAAARRLQWYRSLHQHVQSTETPAVSSEIGLERTLQRIRAERPAASAPAARPVAETGLGARIRGLLAGLLPQPVLRPALAAALAVIVGQGVWIAHVAGPDETAELRAVPPAAVVDKGPYLKVNFKSDAREADIRLLLVETNGSLAGGPGQLGDWFVRVPPAGIEAAAARLRQSPIVEAVAVVDGLPARP